MCINYKNILNILFRVRKHIVVEFINANDFLQISFFYFSVIIMFNNYEVIVFQVIPFHYNLVPLFKL